MTRLIDADELEKKLPNDLPYKASVKRVLIQAPTVDSVKVVRCKDCTMHDRCSTEDVFVNIGKLENPFCCVGKRKENKDIPICLTEDCPYQKGNPCEAWETCGGFEGKENE